MQLLALKKNIYLLYAHEHFACIYICEPSVPGVFGGQKAPRIGVKDDFELSFVI